MLTGHRNILYIFGHVSHETMTRNDRKESGCTFLDIDTSPKSVTVIALDDYLKKLSNALQWLIQPLWRVFFLDDNFIEYTSTPSKAGGFAANPAMLTRCGVLNTTMILNAPQITHKTRYTKTLGKTSANHEETPRETMTATAMQAMCTNR